MTLNKDFYKNISKIAATAKHTSSPCQIFQDLIQMGFNSMLEARVRVRVPHFVFGWHDDLRRELSAYKTDPKSYELLTQTCLMWFKAIRDGEIFEDVLGSSYDEHLGTHLGQFFTPPDLGQLLAAMTVSLSSEGLQEKFKAGVGVVVSDPTGCGGGGLLLPQLKAIYDQFGPSAMKLVCAHGQDVDASMVQLAATQIYYSASMHRTPLGAISISWGNALTEPDAPIGFTCVYDPERINTLTKWLEHGRTPLDASVAHSATHAPQATETPVCEPA